MSKSQEKNQHYSKNIFNKIVIFSRSTDIFKQSDILSDSGGSSRHFDYLFNCLGVIVK